MDGMGEMKMNGFIKMYAGLLFALLSPTIGRAGLMQLTSPDQRIALDVAEADGKLFYTVEFNHKRIISDSRLGVSLKGGAFSGNVVMSGAKKTSNDSTWETVWGDFNTYCDHYNELIIDVADEQVPPCEMQVILRAYNDGIAFRYAFPKQAALKQVDFDKEVSSVSVVSESPIAWYARSSNRVSSATPFAELEAGSLKTPFTIQVSVDCFVSLHEAAVVHSSDASLKLGADARTLTYKSSSKQPAGCVSAWRTVSIADAAAGLIESSLVLNLNEPCALADTSWIKPGVSLWDWRNHGAKADDGFVFGITTESYIRYIDFVAERGLKFVLIDAEWYGPERDKTSDPITWEPEVDVPAICKYAQSKNVGIWLYINNNALKHFDMDRTFSAYRTWGAVGIKHGFLGAGNQVKNEFSIEVLKKCAEHQLMYVLHECNKPTGLRRTYPNIMSFEYTNGMLDAATRPSATPTDLCIFPLAHNLAGPVDRSCGMFDLDDCIARKKVRRQPMGTVVSQAAQCLIFPSGVLTLPDHPDAYHRKIDLFEFIEQLPMTWDETRALNAEIGKWVTIARRTGKEWLVASLVNEKGRTVELNLDFLEEGVVYDITLYEDAEGADYHYAGAESIILARKQKLKWAPAKTNRERYRVRKKQVHKGDTITANIAPGGGHCMWIRPAVNP